MLSVRPKIAELVFQLYGRALHPELFEIYQSRRIKRGGYTANIQITSVGHLITWQYQGLTLTEVATAAHHPLPERRRLMSHPLRGSTSDRIECRGGVQYDAKFSLEPVEPEAFWLYQKEFTRADASSGLVHNFDASGRFGLGAVSYIHVESRDRSLKIQAFHTFPDDYAIVKTQSVFKLPK